jgi:hypothetical protein
MFAFSTCVCLKFGDAPGIYLGRTIQWANTPQRASIEFPFIDLLHDGSTSFRYLPAIFLTAASGMAIQGAKAYGTQVYPAGFDPPCNAYEFSSSSHHPESTYFTAKAENNTALIETLFRTNMLEKPEEFPMQFFVNATNQPIFADGLSCDMYTTFWNTTLAQGANAPVPVSGTVRARFSVFDKALDKEMIWADAVGVRVDLSFIEHGPISCEGLKGYSGPGEQKVEMVEGMESKTAQNASFTPSYRMQSVFAEYPITAMNKARV